MNKEYKQSNILFGRNVISRLEKIGIKPLETISVRMLYTNTTLKYINEIKEAHEKAGECKIIMRGNPAYT